jgi:hypothetical protein
VQTCQIGGARGGPRFSIIALLIHKIFLRAISHLVYRPRGVIIYYSCSAARVAKLSSGLATMLGKPEATRPEVIQAMYVLTTNVATSAVLVAVTMDVLPAAGITYVATT